MITLYPAKTTEFTNNGLGVLADAISCVVTWENNSVYELEMTYPATGQHFDKIDYGLIILAKPSPQIQAQPFVIYKISEPIDEVVTINAQHISYNLAGIPITPYTASSASAAMSQISSNAILSTSPFTFSTDVTTSATFEPSEPSSVREYLGGMEGSILDQFGGEYEFDRFNVILHQSRGNNSGVTLRYGKNITDISQETNIESTVTGVFPFYKSENESTATTVYGDITFAGNHASFPIENVEVVDVSSEFESEEGTTPTKAQVTAAGAAALQDRTYIGVPSISISIKFIPLSQTEEYKDIAPLETVEPCDTITVYFERLGISETAKIHKTVYDSLLDRYEEIEIGDLKKTIGQTIATQTKEIEAVSDEVAESSAKTTARLDVLSNAIEAEVTEREDEDEYLQGLIEVNAGNIDLKVDRSGVISAINLSPESITINSSKINLVGYVTATDLATGGSTTINGSNITTGSISADRISGGEISSSSFYSVNNNYGVVIETGGIYFSLSKIGKAGLYLSGSAIEGNSGPSLLLDAHSGNLGLYADGNVRIMASMGHRIYSDAQHVFKSTSGKSIEVNGGIYYPGYEAVTAQSSVANLRITDGLYISKVASGSSKRYKHDIKLVENEELDSKKLLDVDIVQFKYNKGYLDDDNDSRYDKDIIGFVAEDIAKKYPVACDYNENGEAETWNERYIIPPMLKLIQDQQKQITLLKKEVAELKEAFSFIIENIEEWKGVK